MTARPLFSRLFSWFLLLLVLVVMVVALSLAVGARSSLRRWSARLSNRIELRVAEQLGELVAQRPDPTPLEVERALRGVLTPGMAVGVYNSQGLLLFAYQQGQRMLPRRTTRDRRMPRAPNGPPSVLSQQMLENFRRVPPLENLEATLYFRAANEGFLTDEANRILFASIVRALVLGLIAAVLLASGGAWLVSRSLARSTRRIAGALSEIAGGVRDRSIERGRIRELNQIAETAERLQSDLADQERIRARWAQDVAHDLRTPVAAVIAQLEAVRDGVLPADGERFERMLGQIGRIRSLVEQLNLLTRLESPEQSLHCEAVGSAEAAATIVAAARGQLPDGEGHEITSSPIDDNEGETPAGRTLIELDLDLAVRAVGNLIDNALRYRLAGSRVSTRVEHGAKRLRVVVRNEGTLPEEAGRLFNRLTRGESERSSNGLGLGLSIARAVATRHGGAVTLRTVSGGVVEATIDLLGCVSNDR